MIIYGYRLDSIGGFDYKHLDSVDDGNLKSNELFAIVGICSRASLEIGLVSGWFPAPKTASVKNF